MSDSTENNFTNVYEDVTRADSYAKLEFPGTYYLAYRDIPEIIAKFAQGKNALDFGCGTGRSTRFVKKLGFDVIGIDISPDMIKRAKEFDPNGIYHKINDGDFSFLHQNHFDFITSIFTFDNIPVEEGRLKLLTGLAELINDSGFILLLDSTPEIYFNEWSSFSTKDFPENLNAKSGDKVKIIQTDVEDLRPVEDIIWFDDDYQKLFERANLKLLETFKPLGRSDEKINWINEKEIAPWVIYILKKN